MGADFIFAVLPHCNLTPGREAKALNHISTCENWDDSGYLEVEEMRKLAAEAIKEYPSFAGRRDTGLFSAGYLPNSLRYISYIITGGMSWGDSPTESYDQFNHIEACDGLWAMLLKWAKEPHYGVAGRTARRGYVGDPDSKVRPVPEDKLWAS